MRFPPIPSSAPGAGILGRRSSPRLPLRIPAKLVSVFDTLDCLLVDVSLSGALVRLARPLAVDSCGYLRAGPLDAFAITVRVSSYRGSDALTGLRFDTRLTREQVVELRNFAREAELIEKRARISAARDWVNGIGR